MLARRLNAREERTLQAAAQCLLPADGPFAHGHADVDYQKFVAEYLRCVPREVTFLIHLILWFVEYLGWVFIWWPGRFSRMTCERRHEVLERMHRSRLSFIRGFFILLSTILLIPFYNDSSVMDAIGYGGYQSGVNKQHGEVDEPSVRVVGHPDEQEQT